MESLKEVVIIFGFNCVENPVYDEITREMVRYKLVPYLLEHPEAVIIISGGVRDLLGLKYTEAKQIKRLLWSVGLPKASRDEIILEETSTDAPGNIENSIKIIKKINPFSQLKEVIFIGEAAREKETLWYADVVFKKSGIEVEKIDYWPLNLLSEPKRLIREKQGRWIKSWWGRMFWRLRRAWKVAMR